ncbi:MAG: hypothetical protein HZA89_05265, partial [Verrucomicrobia bacterium]|nr:hypothetical protein [Verrucomicrobiota bacterium]
MIPLRNHSPALGGKRLPVFTALVFALALCGVVCAAEAGSPKGHLVIMGGGSTVPVIRQRALQLAGGTNSR